MAKPAEREKDEKSMLNSIGGRDEKPAEPGAEAPKKSASIGWMGYVGGALWAMVLLGAGAGVSLMIAGGI